MRRLFISSFFQLLSSRISQFPSSSYLRFHTFLPLLLQLLPLLILLSNVGYAVAEQRPPILGSSSILISNNRVLSFGGYYSEKQFRNEFFNDLWIFHITNSTWEHVERSSDDIYPSGRAFHTFQKINETSAILYGGTNAVSQVQGNQGFAGSCQLNDLWHLDLETFVWTEIHKNEDVSFDGYNFQVCSIDVIERYITFDAFMAYILLFGLTAFSLISILFIRLVTR